MIICTFENSKKASLRHVVIDVLVLNGEKILILKRAAHLIEGGKYSIVGGFVERNETIEQAAVREVLEETGYTLKEIKLFKISDNPKRRNDDRQNVSFLYTGQVLEKVGEGDNESSQKCWYGLDNLPSEEEFAFEHLDFINLYKEYLQAPFKIPLIGTLK